MRNATWMLAGCALLLALPCPTAGQSADDEEWIETCQRSADEDREVFCEVRVERLAVRGTVSVDPGRNGGADFIGSDREDIEVHARIQATAESGARAHALARAVTIATDGMLRADAPDTERREYVSVTFVVYVPRQTNVEARSQNGPVSARDLSGIVRLETQNGPVSLLRLSGDVRASAQNGPLHVELSGDHWQGVGLDAETRNGPVTLEVPEDYNAELETGTINGPMTADVPLTVQFMGKRRHLNATLGEGGTKLRVVTTNGPFTLRRS